MASTTCFGFWVVAPLSRYTKGLPFTVRERMGKSSRTRCTSKLTNAVACSIIHKGTSYFAECRDTARDKIHTDEPSYRCRTGAERQALAVHDVERVAVDVSL